MKACAACYVTDEGFLFPSLCAAVALRQACPDVEADVIVFAINVADELISALRAAAAPFGVRIEALWADLGIIDPRAWHGSHVPVAAIGRFLLPEWVARSYDRILYMDGDTMCRSSPEELLRFDPGPGMVGAVEDIRSFGRWDLVGVSGRFTRYYFDDIGIAPDDGYFNSGMFIVRAADWPAMARECLGFLVQNTALCQFHDQSAMNAVLGRSSRVRLSLKWNFQTPYHLLGMFDAIDPALLHFTEAGKPWLGALQPWGEWHRLYREVAELLPAVPRREPWDDAQVAAANRHYARRVRRQNWLFAHRLPGRRRRIRRYEEQCLI